MKLTEEDIQLMVEALADHAAAATRNLTFCRLMLQYVQDGELPRDEFAQAQFDQADAIVSWLSVEENWGETALKALDWRDENEEILNWDLEDGPDDV